MDLPINIDDVKGFLDPDEGRALYQAVLDYAADSPHSLCVEIGSYCGKSTVYLGTACKQIGSLLLAVDHHKGSEENQPGEDYYDPDLYDPHTKGMSSLAHFRETVRHAQLEDVVIPLITQSAMAARIITNPVHFVFIDGGHSQAAALTDYRQWAGKLISGGILAIHDVFPNPADGGRPPYEIYQLALKSGLFEEVGAVKSLRLLQRL